MLKDDTLGLKGDPNVEVGLTQDEVNVASAARQELEVYLDGLSTEQKKIMLEKFTRVVLQTLNHLEAHRVLLETISHSRMITAHTLTALQLEVQLHQVPITLI